MDGAKDSQPPFGFLQKLHAKYPQFAEKGPQGGLMQVGFFFCFVFFV
jgi:hypothetical protein